MNNIVEEWSKEGLSYIEKGEYNDAINCLSKAVEKNPEFFEAWFRLGVAYFYKEDYENALICNLNAWKVNPELSEIEHDIFKCYNKVLELKSKNFNAWWKVGDFFFNKGVYAKALECYDRTIDIIRLSKNSTKLNKLFIKKGDIFSEYGELDSAINNYDRALEVDSSDEFTRKKKQKLLNEIKKKKRCSECGAPLNLKVGQFLGEKQYVIVDIKHLRFLMKKVKNTIDSVSSRKYEKFKRIEENYKKIFSNEVY